MNEQLVNPGSLGLLSNARSLKGTSEDRFCKIVVNVADTTSSDNALNGNWF